METLATRRALLALVERYPGLHVRELARQAEMSEALASYHLQQLLAEGFVEAIEDANFRRFYPRRGAAPTQEDRDIMAILRRRVPLQIALFLLEKGTATNQSLVEELGLAKSTVSYHVAALQTTDFLRRGSDDTIRLADPTRVSRLLIRWKPPQDATSRFADLWSRFYARRRGPSR